MKFIEDTKQEIKKATSSLYLRIALIAVILVPLFYGALYLTAFWDPYDKFSQVPIAVVNLDEGYNNDNSKINIGNDLIDSLKKDNNLKWQFVSKDEADKGLNSKKYYASLTIPANFSADAYSINGSNPTKANLIYKSREATNYLATTITKQVATQVADSLSHKMISKYFDNVFMNLKETANGLIQAKNASTQLVDGLASANNGILNLQSGINSILDGSNQLTDGLKTTNQGQSQLTSGLATAVKGTSDIKSGASMVSSGMSQGQAALNAYIKTNPSAATNPYILGLSNALSASISGQSQVVTGLTTLQLSLVSAEEGSSSLSDGSTKLLSGATALNSGISTISNGVGTLSSGLTDAENGMIKLRDSLASGADAAVAATDDKKVTAEVNVMSSPITLTNNSYDTVANYGSGFAPYFISLALWVGGLLAFFVVDFDNKPQQKKTTIIKYLILSIIGILQAVILGLALQKLVGLSIANPVLYYGFTILMSLTFMSLLQLLIQHLKNTGRYVAIILLILQLASAAGTFPKETIPVFFQAINPFLPMTYSVMGIKDILFTNELSNLWLPIAYFVTMLISCLALNVMLTKKRSLKLA